MDGNPAEVFSTQKDLAKLVAAWPAARLIEIWNSFAGVAPFHELKPVKKFTSRKAAVARIWQAVQRLSPDGVPQAADFAPAPGKPSVNLRRSSSERDRQGPIGLRIIFQFVLAVFPGIDGEGAGASLPLAAGSRVGLKGNARHDVMGNLLIRPLNDVLVLVNSHH